MGRVPATARPVGDRARRVPGGRARDLEACPPRPRRALARGDARRHGRDLPRRAGAGRAVARLHHADEAADHDPAAADRRGRDVRRRAGRAAARDLRRDDGRSRAGLRRSERPQPRARPRPRPADEPHRPPPGRRGAGHTRAGSGVRPRADGVLVRAAGLAGQRADRGARTRRRPLLRPGLHALAEADDAAEHRHRRRGGRGPAARGLGGGDRQPERAGACSCS